MPDLDDAISRPQPWGGGGKPHGSFDGKTAGVEFYGDIVLAGSLIYDIELAGSLIYDIELAGALTYDIELEGGLDVTAVKQNFSMFRGDKKRITIPVVDAAGASVTLTGASAKWQAWRGGVVVLSKVPDIVSYGAGTDNALQFTIDAADTEAIVMAGEQVYDHEAEVRDVGTAPSTVAVGKLTLMPDLIPPPS